MLALRRARQHGIRLSSRFGEVSVRVLVVEDEPPLAQAIARGLRAEGMAVDVALDGGDALAKAGVWPV